MKIGSNIVVIVAALWVTVLDLRKAKSTFWIVYHVSAIVLLCCLLVIEIDKT